MAIGQLVRKAEGSWLLKVYIGRLPSGSPRYFSRAFKGTEPEARAELKRLQTLKAQGENLEYLNVTLGSWAEEWLEELKGKIRGRTHDFYRRIVDRYVSPELKALRLEKVTRRDVIQALNNIQVWKGQAPSAATQKHIILTLRQIFKTALERGLIQVNPVKSIKPPKVEREPKALTSDELRRFLAAIEGDRFEALFKLAVTTGLRPEEYLALRWEDLEETKIYIRRTVAFRNGWEICPTKTRKSKRVAYLAPEVARLLEKVRGSEGFIFKTAGGLPVRPHYIRKNHFLPALKRAGITAHVTLYSLRHTFATQLLDKGTNPKVVSELMGHASVAFTLDVYTGALPVQHEAARGVIEGLLV